MARLVDRTLDAIRTIDSATIENTILMAYSLLEKYAGGRLGEPWCPEVIEAEVTDEDIINLRDALIDLVKTHPLDDYAATAAFVLGKWEDRTAIPSLGEFMNLNFMQLKFTKLDHNEPRTRAVWNAMNALDHLGEDVFPWEDGHKYSSCTEIEKNRELAARYLNKKGHSCQ